MKFVRVCVATFCLMGLMMTGCASAPRPADSPPSTPAYLVALLPMKEGFGPADHDAYEKRIAPIGAEHGMSRETALTLVKHLGGSGPANASTLGVWALRSQESLKQVMSDPRYLEQVSYRDQIHDMANAQMFVTSQEVDNEVSLHNRTILVGILTMKPGYGFEDHKQYEQDIATVTSRHGMRLVRSFKVAKRPDAEGPSADVIAIWTLPTPEALGAIMQDPEYVANIGNRDRMHDMSNTTMYFAQLRSEK